MDMNKVNKYVLESLEHAAEYAFNQAGKPEYDPFSTDSMTAPVPFSLNEKMDVLREFIALINRYADEHA